MDYSKYYSLETYLFNEVAINFHNKGYLTGEEFFCIIIWKSNRAKSKIAKKFENETNLNLGIKKLTSTIYETVNNKDKLAVLMNDYGFYLPIASAILSVLYKDEFSVYDIRVCNMLEKKYKTKKYHRIKNWTFEKLWKGYEEYLQKTLELSGKSSFREADKYLWSKSFYEQLIKDMENKFR
ncbi:hypothetical protein KC678_01485 [Candidatus Dojkabacteria bacterium]|uniref:Uncharacterized protein n=1 Tax=Candidatus Dojkabacteria bacterium TaxID=2099670 RepID=A0A955L1L6_9BACT|nr:hypothetical protein [Candidatus Dojkabacteria bacterium]